MKLYHTSSDLSITSPIRIDLTLHRDQNGIDQECVFVWNKFKAFARTQFILLQQKGDILEQVDVGQKNIDLLRDEDNIMQVNGWNNGLEQLRPGGSQCTVETLPDNYHKLLIPGERYRLIWPGEEISMWDWGSKLDHVGNELKSQMMRESKLPRLILPACAGVEFTAKEELEPWPDRAEYESKFGFVRANFKEAEWRLEQNPPPSPPPISPSERVPEAPILKVTLEGTGSHVTRNSDFVVSSQVTYEKPVGATGEGKPVTFHIYDFSYAYRLYRLRGGKWKRCETEDTMRTGFMIVDLPDETVKVNQDKDFVTLRPGESWTTQETVQKPDYTHIPDDSVVGDTFRYVFKGTTLDWWDWGNKEDHSGTEVTLPCFHWGSVVKPADNDGRPKLVVPGSNVVEFTIVDG
ncbi:uncharacterized protein LY89DRAFT_711234 [Mollisia scopiformis]|uniref:Uncharacterized protein n=1 Tax=Mollisia scopiformis TaxID=149040 RepID=A0A132BB05_MOLSC|nr:uncharacterized protein LY89DRAFT_711234 [Mollisia scopiformis]KUJ09453.1 hypothetical protein LY89DRAFT_711234 [Mollisia scopiformis]